MPQTLEDTLLFYSRALVLANKRVLKLIRKYDPEKFFLENIFIKKNGQALLMNDTRGFYKVLGLEPGSSLEDIKRAYSKLVRLYHPDHGSEMRKAKQITDEKRRGHKVKELEEKCRKINEAKAFLSDEKNKQMYDRGIDPENMGHDSSSFFDIMSHFARRSDKKKVKDTVHKVRITFKESFLGKKTKYKIKRRVLCRSCDGKGGKNVKTCNKCNGRGKIQFKTNQVFFVSIQERICDGCNGSKNVIAGDPCKDCNGKKMQAEENIREVDIPPGIKDGETIVFENGGDEHPEHEGGHLIFLINVSEDPNFVRVNDDIVSKVKVDLFYALVGGDISFTHLDGRVLQIAIGKVTNFENGIVLKGEGFESSRGHGDLYLKPEYVIPSNINKEKLKDALPPSIKAHGNGERIMGFYGALPQEEVSHDEHHGAEGFFSEFTFF